MINILIVDDHQIIIDGLKSILEDEKNMQVVAEALDGQEALDILDKEKDMQVILLDISMPGMGGLEAAQIIKQKHPQLKVLILSMSKEIDYINMLMVDLKADGYILKNKGKEELVKAIHEVSQGRQYFGEGIKDHLFKDMLRDKQKPEVVIEKIVLTKREKEVLELISQEMTTKEIAATLQITDSTVETHRRNLIRKTKVKNSLGLMKYAVQNGYFNE